MKSVPSFFTQSTVLLTDDNLNFLEGLAFELDSHDIHTKIYEHSKKALDFLNEDYQPGITENSFVSCSEDQEFDKASIDVDIRAIHETIYNPKRFDDITVAVIDYAMPSLNGLDFAEQIKYENIKKILLTGEADDKIAIDAFNAGIINRFITKKPNKILDILVPALRELQHLYFLHLSNHITQAMTATDRKIKCLDDPKFIQLFQQSCEKYRTVEYYLLDSHGSFLLLDAAANPTWLIVKEDQEIDDLHDLAKFSGECEPAILTALESREKVPFFFSDEDFATPPAGWAKYLHSASPLAGAQEHYYYAIVEGNELYQLDRDAILSYQDFLQQQD